MRPSSFVYKCDHCKKWAHSVSLVEGDIVCAKCRHEITKVVYGPEAQDYYQEAAA